jgi:hypothetical protein
MQQDFAGLMYSLSYHYGRFIEQVSWTLQFIHKKHKSCQVKMTSAQTREYQGSTYISLVNREGQHQQVEGKTNAQMTYFEGEGGLQ